MSSNVVSSPMHVQSRASRALDFREATSNDADRRLEQSARPSPVGAIMAPPRIGSPQLSGLVSLGTRSVMPTVAQEGSPRWARAPVTEPNNIIEVKYKVNILTRRFRRMDFICCYAA
jgi:hypothetical protein